MVDFCLKKIICLYCRIGGDIITIDKPSIQKDFCFGYSDSRYDTDDYDRANNMVDHASKSEEYFIKENLKSINNMINNLEGKNKYYTGIQYTGQSNEQQIKSIKTI